MLDTSVLIGGRAGEGINVAGMGIARLFGRLGYNTYMYFDYPSLIKGGHNFGVIRASEEKITAHRNRADFIIALNQDTIDLHRDIMGPDTVIVYDSSRARSEGVGIPVDEILKAENAPPIMLNSCMLGAFAHAAGIPWQVVEEVFRKHLPKATGQNLRVARRGYDASDQWKAVPTIERAPLPAISGNEAIGIGLVRGGLEAYVAYPMTPTSNLLHFLAEQADTFGLTVLHPENEIAVMLAALGFAYAGKKTAVGTSGGGFCLMTEGFSLAGQAEIPVVVVMGQRTGPSTGLPTYTAQSDLLFVLHAGQGEFPRFVVAPGDAEEACTWSSVALQVAWQFQIPAVILGDKTLCEGIFSFDERLVRPGGVAGPGEPAVTPYRRYADTPSGISPLRSPPLPGAAIKVNGYAHDESGVTTEAPGMVNLMVEKRIRKEHALNEAVIRMETVAVSGSLEATTALLCWGSTKGVCREVAGRMGIRTVQPIVLSPFPVVQFQVALQGIHHLIAVEENVYGQLATLVRRYGFEVQDSIGRYDGRPFTVDALEAEVRKVVR
jgi:2-oxoglutarate/2-oxoacid ferredoxin oxidoreductase subunit alpha